MSITKISPSVVDFDAGITISTADNTTQLTLKSTDADANTGPVLNLQRDSGSPADNDYIGNIKLQADNDAGEVLDHVSILGQIVDASDGTEDAKLTTYVLTAGTVRNALEINPTEIVINEDSIDRNFRVESDGNTRAISILGDKYGLGVGRDPETAYNGYASVELGQQGAILANEAGDDFWFGSNVYLDGSGNSTRKEAGVAALLQIDGDVISWYTAGSGSADTTISWSMKNRFSSDGNLSFLSGQGIDFSATADATGSSSEVLDDYEEGTWTPVLSGVTTAGTFSAGTGTAGRYIKIGKLCYVAVSLRNSTLSGAAGTLKISGLPFATYDNQLFSISSALMMLNFNFDTNDIQAFYASNDVLYGIESVNGAAWTDWNVTNNSALYLQMTCVYEVDE